MPKHKIRDEKIQVNLTASEKKQIQIMAEKAKRSLSQYLLEAALSQTLDTAKMDFYLSINDNLKYLKRMAAVVTKLELLIATEQNDQEFVVKFYKTALEKAEKQFPDE